MRLLLILASILVVIGVFFVLPWKVAMFVAVPAWLLGAWLWLDYMWPKQKGQG